MKHHIARIKQFDLSIDFFPLPKQPYVGDPPTDRTILMISSDGFELELPLSEGDLDKLIWQLRLAKAGRTEGGSSKVGYA